MAKRNATPQEQERIEQANEVLRSLNLEISECKEIIGGGAVVPTKGF